MVGTLIKHESRRTLPGLVTIHGISTAAILMAGVLAGLSIMVLSDLAVFILIVLLGGTLIVSQIYLAVDFWNTGFRQYGYLTHSLPVKGSLILRARLLWAAVVAAFSLVWVSVMTAVGVALMMPRVIPGSNGWQIVLDGLRSLWRVAEPWQLLLLVLLAWFFVWSWQVNLYFAASLGSTPRLVGLGVGGPILVWVLSWLAMQVIAGLSLLIPLGYGDLGDGVGLFVINVPEAMGMRRSLPFVPVGWIPLVMLSTVMILIWMRHIWNRRISLR